MAKIENLEQDVAQAMRDGNTDRLQVLRLIKNSLKNEQIKLGHELSADETLKIVAREAKQRRDSITAYEQANRADLVAVEQAELKVIDEYLPQQMSEADIEGIIDTVLAETGATSKAQMGQVMAAVMKQTAGAADGAVVSRLVGAKLT